MSQAKCHICKNNPQDGSTCGFIGICDNNSHFVERDEIVVRENESKELERKVAWKKLVDKFAKKSQHG